MNHKKIIKIVSIIFMILILAIFLFIFLSYSSFKTEILSFVNSYGYTAIFISSFLLDLLFQPLAPDVSLIGGILADLNIYYVLLYVLIGSSLASILGYALGRIYGEVGIKKIYGERKYNKWKDQYYKHGRIILLAAALTPLPYTPLCWISGIFKLKKTEFFVFAILARIVRFVSVAYLTILISAI